MIYKSWHSTQKCSQTIDSDLRYTPTDTISLTPPSLSHTRTHLHFDIRRILKAVSKQSMFTRTLFRAKEARDSNAHATKYDHDRGPRSRCLRGCFPFPQIHDAHRQRFEVPHEHVGSLKSDPSSPIGNTLEISQKPFGLTVRRKENKKVL